MNNENYTSPRTVGDLSVVDGSPLWTVLAEVEAAHFRTVEDTGSNPHAMLVWNALRRRLGLPWLSKDQLPAWDGKAYTMPADSTLLANTQVSNDHRNTTDSNS